MVWKHLGFTRGDGCAGICILIEDTVIVGLKDAKGYRDLKRDIKVVREEYILLRRGSSQ